MENDLIFSAGRIKAVEKKLLSQDKIARLSDAVDLLDAVNILTEYGYGAGITVDTPFEYEKILREEETVFDKFIKEIIPKGYGFEVFLTENDFFNAKVCLKSKYFSVPVPQEAVKSGYLFSFDKLNDLILLSPEKELPEEMSDAILSLDKTSAAGKLKPSVVDATLDKAFLKYVFNYCKGEKAKVIRNFYSFLSDANNLLTFARAKQVSVKTEDFEKMLLPYGKVSETDFVNAYKLDNLVALKEKYKNTPLEKFFFSVTEENTFSFVDAERIRDEVVFDYVHSFKSDLFSVGCVINYYLSKKTEIKNIRIILTGKKNNIPSDQVKKRLRKIYA